MTWLEKRIPPLLLAALFGLVMAACAGMFGIVTLILPGQRMAAGAIFAIGIAIMLAAVLGFRRAGTTVDPLHPEAASALVDGGVFRFSRNPIYLGMAILLLAWAIYLGNAVALLLVAAFVKWIGRFQIAPEERALRARFGEAYERYCARVRRWV